MSISSEPFFVKLDVKKLLLSSFPTLHHLLLVISYPVKGEKWIIWKTASVVNYEVSQSVSCGLSNVLHKLCHKKLLLNTISDFS